jgi:hypothetical protein
MKHGLLLKLTPVPSLKLERGDYGLSMIHNTQHIKEPPPLCFAERVTGVSLGRERVGGELKKERSGLNFPVKKKFIRWKF